MNFSTKIKKFYEGMRVYDCLLEDEKAIHLPFALSFTVTITTILDQLRMFLSDLANNVCREIPDIDYDIMTDALKIMSKKLKVDMEALGNLTIRQLLEELFGAHLDKTPLEMHNFIFDSVRQMAEMIKQIHKGVKNADPALFEDYFINHIRDHNWTDVEKIYKKWKGKFTKVTMEMLEEKQEEVIREALEREIMCQAATPSKIKMENVDYDYHVRRLAHDFDDTIDYKESYTKLMQYATRKDGMLILNLKEYGKYVFDNICVVSEGQKVALFELYIVLNLIHQDMANLNPELCKHLPKTGDESLEGTEYFAVFIHLYKVFEKPWFAKCRSDRKYDLEWVKKFLEDLMKSEWRDEILADWRKPNMKKKVLAFILASLNSAGVLKGSGLSIASAVVPFADFDGKKNIPKAFHSYFSEGREKGYYEWICDYVKQ